MVLATVSLHTQHAAASARSDVAQRARGASSARGLAQLDNEMTIATARRSPRASLPVLARASMPIVVVLPNVRRSQTRFPAASRVQIPNLFHQGTRAFG